MHFSGEVLVDSQLPPAGQTCLEPLMLVPPSISPLEEGRLNEALVVI